MCQEFLIFLIELFLSTLHFCLVPVSYTHLDVYKRQSKSSFGRGGMLTKTNIARKVADEGITVIIANGKRDNILVDLLHQELPSLFPDVQSSALDSQLTYTTQSGKTSAE